MRLACAMALALSLAWPALASAQPAEPDHPQWPQSREPMPFDIIRSLQFLQDQVARGNDRAIRVQALLLRRFGPVFLDAAADDWSDPRNRRAAVLFVLSGGPPEVLAGLINAGVLAQEQRPIFDGALAYVRNDLVSARKILGGLDLSEEEPGLAAHIHLVLGQTMQESDPAAATVHLDQARLLAPGGLIEEAALRLEVLLVDGLGDHERADRLARQYFDRYSRSSYSANFEARFAALQSARGAGEAQAAVAAMDEVLAALPGRRKASIYLAVSRRALVEGRLELARLSSARALAIDELPVRDVERGRLYDLASSLAIRPTAEVRQALAGLSREQLHPEDGKLLTAAEQIVGEIDEPVASLRSAELDQATPDTPSPVMERAARVLAETSSPAGNAVQ